MWKTLFLSCKMLQPWPKKYINQKKSGNEWLMDKQVHGGASLPEKNIQKRSNEDDIINTTLASHPQNKQAKYC